MVRLVAFVLTFLAVIFVGATAWPDCSKVPSSVEGPYGPVTKVDVEWRGRPLVVLLPRGLGEALAPVLIFMHGITAELGMYEVLLRRYASHGFVVVFPYIKSPEGDRSPLATSTNGEFILRGIEYVASAAADPASPLHGVVDTETVTIAGHSMGATSAIMAGRRLAQKGGLIPRVVVAQHPGVCGPVGPPPWPATWLKRDLAAAAATSPILLTTSTDDGAFWPAPHTAEHERGCFLGAGLAQDTAAFVQFSTDACTRDDRRPPYDDGGHNCAFKEDVETPWVLTALRLYAHHGGKTDSACWKTLWGDGAGTIGGDPNVEALIRYHKSTRLLTQRPAPTYI